MEPHNINISNPRLIADASLQSTSSVHRITRRSDHESPVNPDTIGEQIVAASQRRETTLIPGAQNYAISHSVAADFLNTLEGPTTNEAPIAGSRHGGKTRGAPVDITRVLEAVQAIHAREKKAAGSDSNSGAAAASSASPVAILEKEVIDQLVAGLDIVANDVIAHSNPLKCATRMIRIADAFEPLATTAKRGGTLGAHAKTEGRKMLEKMSEVCWQLKAPEEDWKPKHEIRVQKAMVKLVFQYAHVFYDNPKELAQLLSMVIKQAGCLHDSAANRAYDAQGQIARRLEENLKEYPIETLIELADSITPQDIAAFSPKPLAGHTQVGHKTWRLGPFIDVPNPPVEKFTKGFFRYLHSPFSPDARDVPAYEGLGEIPLFLAKSVDKAYQRFKNHVTERLSGRDRMIKLMLVEMLHHPGMTVDHLHTYLARILHTADIYDPMRTHPFGQWADFVRGRIPEADRCGVDSKLAVLSDGAPVVETNAQPVEAADPRFVNDLIEVD